MELWVFEVIEVRGDGAGVHADLLLKGPHDAKILSSYRYFRVDHLAPLSSGGQNESEILGDLKRLQLQIVHLLAHRDFAYSYKHDLPTRYSEFPPIP